MRHRPDRVHPGAAARGNSPPVPARAAATLFIEGHQQVSLSLITLTALKHPPPPEAHQQVRFPDIQMGFRQGAPGICLFGVERDQPLTDFRFWHNGATPNKMRNSSLRSQRLWRRIVSMPLFITGAFGSCHCSLGRLGHL